MAADTSASTGAAPGKSRRRVNPAMAFGKKGKNQDEAASVPSPTVDAGGTEEDTLSSSMFAAEQPAAEEPAPSPEPVAAEQPSEAGGALGGDLLNMFQTTQIEVDDLSVVLELAGDVELSDLVEELNTVAAALGISRGGDFDAAS